MAKPNYSFEKRQRELAKKQKKEIKEKERAERKSQTGESTAADESPSAPPPTDKPSMGPTGG